ncbi:MAG TPA: efflux RND transporter periplasmic adaptor subunit [Vicinamibacterales bacterium]|nr:efflux RND transporter periplasmic adaptor subunit [Vicinamibacterales bacterium]
MKTNVFLAFAVLAAAGAGCDGAAQAKKSDAKDVLAVDVVTVQQIDLRRSVEAVGTLEAHDQATISAEVAGRVARMAVDMGDKVKAGSPLVLLDAERLRYHANEQEAALQQARAKLGAQGDHLPPPGQTPDVLSAAAKRAQAQQSYDRARALAEKNLISRQDLEAAQTNLQTAVAAHEAAIAAERELRAEMVAREATLNSATRDLKDTTIRAPFDGVVAERMVSEGQYVTAQAPVVRLVRLDPLRLTADVPEKFAPNVHVGQPIELTTDAFPDTPVTGTITRISPDVNLKSRAFAIEADVRNEDGQLKPGTFARLTIATNKVDHAIVVPATAIQTKYGTSVAFILENGKLKASEVKLGDRLGPRVEITEGLQAGQSIVSDDVDGLTSGMAARPKTAGDSVDSSSGTGGKHKKGDAK